MRKSKRTQILDAVVAIIQRGGVTAVTFDAVAEEAKLTRGGLIYHFPSREDLIFETHRYLAEGWEEALSTAAGNKAEAATPEQRYAAYVQTCARAADRAELAMMLESASDTRLGELWQDVIDRWAPPVPDSDDEFGLSRFIARLAADGLWAHEALSARPLPKKLKDRICRRLIAMTE